MRSYLWLSLQRAVTLTQQLQNYKEWQSKVVRMVGKSKGDAIFSGGIHLLSAGSSDFLQNYYINPLLNTIYSPEQFSRLLLRSYSSFIQVCAFEMVRELMHNW